MPGTKTRKRKLPKLAVESGASSQTDEFSAPMTRKPALLLKRRQLGQPGLFSEAGEDEIRAGVAVIREFLRPDDEFDELLIRHRGQVAALIDWYYAKRREMGAVSDSDVRTYVKPIHDALNELLQVISDTDRAILIEINRLVALRFNDHDVRKPQRTDQLFTTAKEIFDTSKAIIDAKSQPGRTENTAVNKSAQLAICLYENIMGHKFPRSANLGRDKGVSKAFAEPHALFVYKLLASIDPDITPTHVCSGLRAAFAQDRKSKI